jgi:hypothetical protein
VPAKDRKLKGMGPTSSEAPLKKLFVLEMFAGTCSFAKAAQARGHRTFTTDFDPKFKTDWVGDVMLFEPHKLMDVPPDVIWASPPCEAFTVVVIGKNWHKDLRDAEGNPMPKLPRAELGIKVARRTLEVIKDVAAWREELGLSPLTFFIENPRAMLRKFPMMMKLPIRNTVTYCQYGDVRQKPTDIWTNCKEWTSRPICQKGAPCHIAAPRGSTTGTQGMKNYMEKARVPAKLCDEVLAVLDGGGTDHAAPPPVDTGPQLNLL